MFVPFDPSVRVNLGVVALGTPQRLVDCLEALVAHDSRHEFTIACVVNDAGDEQGRELPEGIVVERPLGNLGWAGGLHRARGLTDAELFVWVQEDTTPTAGWLDALVDAADANPEVGVFGSVRVGDEGNVMLPNAGDATPVDKVGGWNLTDRTAERLPDQVTRCDWVSSRGLLTRTRVFDEVHGPDPRCFPLSHVDVDYCTHVRCHGWDVALVPAARQQTPGSQSAPSQFRQFLAPWRDAWFDDRWADSVARLAGSSSRQIEHPCADWRELRADAVEASVAIEASRLLVPFARHSAKAYAGLEVQTAAHADRADEATQQLQQAVERVSALEAAQRRLRRRNRRLRRERDEARDALAAGGESTFSRLIRGVRRVVGAARSR